MSTPSQAVVCKTCGASDKTFHHVRRMLCVECFNKKAVEYQRNHRNKIKSQTRNVNCKQCGKEFDASIMGRVTLCHECNHAYHVAYKQKDKERHQEYSRRYRARLGDVYRERCVEKRKQSISEMSDKELAEFRQKERDKSARIVAELRRQVFNAYGGFKCACCGEENPLFLSIDHVDNDGAEMRKNGVHGRGGTAFYQWIRKNSFPGGFQVLCMNCNVGKHRNGGVCPHKQQKV